MAEVPPIKVPVQVRLHCVLCEAERGSTLAKAIVAYDEHSSLETALAVVDAARAQVTAEADLEERLGIALHQRDVWRDAHQAVISEAMDASAAASKAQAAATDWQERYARLANRVGAMHGGEL